MTVSSRALGALVLLACTCLAACSSGAPSASPVPSPSLVSSAEATATDAIASEAPTVAPETPTPPSEPAGSPIGESLPPASLMIPTSEPSASSSPTSSTPSSSADPTGPLSSADPAEPTIDAATGAKLQRVLDRIVSRLGVQGVSAAVLLDDGASWTGVAGDRVAKKSTPVDQETVFSIASITKTFVTALVMQLVAEGKLSLDDTLDRWVPSVPNADQITIAELLSHTGGVYNYFENAKYNRMVFADPTHRWTFDEIMGLVRGPYCKPAACYHYSNTDFVLLGHIVEQVTGKPLADEVASRLTGPLSMDHTGLQPDDPTPADRAHAYLGSRDWTRNSTMLPTISAATVADAAGAMVSTATDLATWASALYGGEVVPQAQLDEMLQFKKCHDNYGLGTRKVIIDGRAAIGHLGSLRGYTDAMWHFPREGATIVLLSNQGAWNITAGVQELAETLWRGIDAAAPRYARSENSRVHDGVTLYC
jgi:D-alanyl-D-alanine carboxypeptidase